VNGTVLKYIRARKRGQPVIYPGNAPNHIAEIAIASTLFVLTGAIAILRWRNPDLFHGRYKALYIAAHFVAFGLVAVQGFLGGIICTDFRSKKEVPPVHLFHRRYFIILSELGVIIFSILISSLLQA
jgi:hypothetical protein